VPHNLFFSQFKLYPQYISPVLFPSPSLLPSSFFNTFSPVELCGTVPKRQPSIGILHVQYVAMTIHGIIALLLFCHDRELYSGWIELFRKIRGKFKPRAGNSKSMRRRREVELPSVGSNGSTQNALVESPTPAAVA
jgi:hypothetical protein